MRKSRGGGWSQTPKFKANCACSLNNIIFASAKHQHTASALLMPADAWIFCFYFLFTFWPATLMRPPPLPPQARRHDAPPRCHAQQQMRQPHPSTPYQPSDHNNTPLTPLRAFPFCPQTAHNFVGATPRQAVNGLGARGFLSTGASRRQRHGSSGTRRGLSGAKRGPGGPTESVRRSVNVSGNDALSVKQGKYHHTI